MSNPKQISVALSALLLLGVGAVLMQLPNSAKTQKPSPPVQKPVNAPDQPTPTSVLAVHLPPPPAPAPTPQPEATIPAPEVIEPAVKAKRVQVSDLNSTPPAKPKLTAKSVPPTQKTDPVETRTVEAVVSHVPLTAVSQGRALLRLLEHGKGPVIEIAWPASAKDRSLLYEIFTNCFDMQSLLLNDQKRLLRSGGHRGEAWQPNFDKFSGFVRQVTGDVSPSEQSKFAAIRRHHRTGGTAVRLFPRHHDAVLLSGLNALTQNNYPKSGMIRAAYKISRAGEVLVTNVLINGVPARGSLNVTRISGVSGRCRQHQSAS